MAQYCTIVAVARGGWCFYDCVAKQARRDSDPIEFDCLAVAALAIEQLIIRREEFEDGMPENSEHWNRLFEHEDGACEVVLYRVVDQLNYVLDKILAYTHNPQVLDTIYYANDPGIRALLQAFAISMLRAKPPTDWIKEGYAANF